MDTPPAPELAAPPAEEPPPWADEPEPSDAEELPVDHDAFAVAPEPEPPAAVEPEPPAAVEPEPPGVTEPQLPGAPQAPAPAHDPAPGVESAPVHEPVHEPASVVEPAPVPLVPAPGPAEQHAEPIEHEPVSAPEQPAAGRTPPAPEPPAAAGGTGAPPSAGGRGAGRAREGRGGAAPPPRARRGRSPLARLGAVAALVAVVAAVLLLLHSLLRSGSKAPAAPAVVKVVIPEGLTRTQIGEIAKKAGLRGSYRIASRSSHQLNPAHYGAPPGTRDLEGFLFPATYDAYRGSPVSQLVSDQLIAFRENFDAALAASARAQHVTPYQLLIVASMVEREAQVPGDRAKIAAVIYNRLRQEVPLGIDATIYYALEQEKNIPTYTQELSQAQLHLDSPYNTRTHVGLPPTPISNPGRASIEAAAHPAKVAYMYYVLAPDGCGEHVFSTTLAAFEAAAASYQAAVKKNGGHPPVCKK